MTYRYCHYLLPATWEVRVMATSASAEPWCTQSYCCCDHHLDIAAREMHKTIVGFTGYLELRKLDPPKMIEVSRIADAMDAAGGIDGQWNGGDVCDAVALLVEARGGWHYCPDHGNYSATKERCPFDHTSIDKEGES